MPGNDTTFDENLVPPGQGGFCLNTATKPTRRCATAVAVVRSVADERGTPTTPAVAVGHCIPYSTEEGSLFSREPRMPHWRRHVR